jgi:hypothetical protein
VHEIVLIEDGCCHPGELDQYEQFLRSRLDACATVTKLGVGGHLGFAAVPPDLGNRLLAQGANELPIVALDGYMLHHGSLPDWSTSLAVIESHMAEARPDCLIEA